MGAARVSGLHSPQSIGGFQALRATFGMGTAKMIETELTLNTDVRIVSRSSFRAAERLTESVGFRPPVILMSRID